MAEVIYMPKLSDTMEEGGIANWLKSEGDQVDEGDALVEIETDKATQEYESPEEGVLLKILAEAGRTYALGAPIAVVGEKGEDVDLSALVQATPAAASPAPEPAASAPAADPAPAAAPAAAQAPAAAPTVTHATPGGRVKASPLARKVAADRGIDLNQVAGSGPAGRIVLKDVESAKSTPTAVPGVAAPSMADVQIPNTMMRKTIAKRLLAGKNDAPHFYLTVSADMTKMNAWRKRLNADAGDGIPKVSVNDLIILACAKALRRHPECNAAWSDDAITRFGNVHVAMAVALPEGLITPVVRHTDTLGVREVARQTKELGRRAKGGELTADDYTGGTFTVSNLGMFGIEEFTAIINPPQAAILAVGTTQVVPWVNDDGDIVACPRMKMTMSCDHRVIDGALGAQFLQTLVAYLEDPLMMMA